ncbi:MAG: glycosyltransferase [Desulfobulbaceae bacterium]|nr:glycosyltransferase [Desulfobulbaceae bacterium]
MTPAKALLQIRYGYPGLMTTCDEYLHSFDKCEYRKIVVFLCGKENEAIRSSIEADKVIFLQLEKKQLRGLSISAVKQLLYLCRSEKVDIVLAHRYKSLKIIVLTSIFYDFKIIMGIVHRFGQFKTLARRITGKTFIQRGIKLVAVSEALKKDILDSGINASPDDVLALANCVDIETMEKDLLSREKSRDQLHLAKDLFVVGTIARLSEAKDYPTLLRSFAAVKKQINKSVLVIVGEGHLRSELKREVEQLQIADSVIFTGRINNAWRIIPAFDVFVLSSQYEPFGRVLLEAMLAKVPIVSTDSGGTREVLGDYPLQPPGGVTQISRAVIDMHSMTSTEKEQLTDNLYDRLQKYFSRSYFKEKLLMFIQSLNNF